VERETWAWFVHDGRGEYLPVPVGMLEVGWAAYVALGCRAAAFVGGVDVG
jgi:hypothetical protein